MVFSRYFISAALILAEFALLIYLTVSASTYSAFALGFSVCMNILAVFSLINRDANPEYKVSWLVVVLFVPFFGLVLYYLFYALRGSEKERKLMLNIRRTFEEANDKLRAESDEGDGTRVELNSPITERDAVFSDLKGRNASAGGKALAIMGDDPLAEIFVGSFSEYFELGEKMFESMLRDIRKAEKFIFMEYFIIDKGSMWERIHSLLKEKVKEGVEVRVLYDDIGCMKSLPGDFHRQLSGEGIKCLPFSPLSPRISGTHNNRDHRKILIVDGLSAYTGGINLADEYINEKKRFGHWKDGGIRVTGMAVGGFLKLFLSMWDYTSGKPSDPLLYLSQVKGCENEDGGFYVPFGSGPLPMYSSPTGKNVLLNLINQAERYLYVTTPYLIIDYDLTQALCNAAKRGVDVRIITPGTPDKKTVKLMTKSSYSYLIQHGVRIFEYIPGFIHEKTVISDDLYALVGTINFDYRSLAHHFEDAVWIFGCRTVTDIRDGFLKTAAVSDEKDCEGVRLSFLERLLRNIIRVFAPLL